MAHDLGCGRIEMCPILPGNFSGAEELNICFIDEGRRLERVIRPLTIQVCSCDRAKFIVDKTHDAVESVAIALAPVCQKFGDALWIFPHHRPYGRNCTKEKFTDDGVPNLRMSLVRLRGLYVPNVPNAFPSFMHDFC